MNWSQLCWRCRELEDEAMHGLSAHSMTQVSMELTKGRMPGGNSGERMYLDALLDLRKKQAAVGGGGGGVNQVTVG